VLTVQEAIQEAISTISYLVQNTSLCSHYMAEWLHALRSTKCICRIRLHKLHIRMHLRTAT